MPPLWTEAAPAKVNLTLHVTGQRADGYHLLDSLVVFPRIGDRLEAEPAPHLSLTVTGPFAASLGTGADNLVMRAAHLLRPPEHGAALRLTKTLPVASGLGGGSADAAAALRLLARMWDCTLPPAGAVLRLGADVPACLLSRTCRMRGTGEQIDPVGLPPLWVVLVHPGVPVATGAVFAALTERCNPGMPDELPERGFNTLSTFLRGQRNDLEPPALALAPKIGEVLRALRAQAGCAVARMSGSGGTCFGLFADAAGASGAASALRRAEPSWWVVAGPVEA